MQESVPTPSPQDDLGASSGLPAGRRGDWYQVPLLQEGVPVQEDVQLQGSHHEGFLQVKEADVLCGLFKALIHEEFPQVEEAEVLRGFGNSGGTVSLKFRM